MKYNTTFRFLLLALLGLSPTLLWGQQAIVAAGGDVATKNGSLAISCGEVAVLTSEARGVTVVNVTASFHEGVQQPFTDQDAAQQSIEALSVSINVYPNPTTDVVMIETGDSDNELTYTLYSAEGRALQSGKHSQGSTEINVRDLATGSYMLRVSSPDKKETNVYKIIKVK